jgi:WD40 repeat protein
MPVAWGPTGDVLASVSRTDALLTLWVIPDEGEPVKQLLSGHNPEHSILCIVWETTVNRIVTGSNEGEVIVWNGATGALMYKYLFTEPSYRIRNNPVLSVALTPDGKWVVIGQANINNYVKVWQPATNTTHNLRVWNDSRPFPAFNTSVACNLGGYDPHRLQLAGGSDTALPNRRYGRPGVYNPFLSLFTISDVSGSADITLLEFGSTQCMGITAAIKSLAWNNAGTRLVSGFSDGHVIVWATDNPKPTQIWRTCVSSDGFTWSNPRLHTVLWRVFEDDMGNRYDTIVIGTGEVTLMYEEACDVEDPDYVRVSTVGSVGLAYNTTTGRFVCGYVDAVPLVVFDLSDLEHARVIDDTPPIPPGDASDGSTDEEGEGFTIFETEKFNLLLY